ncbi:MAG: lysophospholipid acyltransferase family protein [Phycisphaerae bacterium]|nr:lysophospholipid acyltransferase family protein [Phycisphaerae bacterium]
MFLRLRFYGISNIPRKGAFLLISNHQSFFDPLFVGTRARRTLVFMARDTLFKKKFFGWLIHSVKAIPVRRGEADLSAIRTIIDQLKKGQSVCLFPEGTRTENGRIAEFKPGFSLLARRANVPILPAVIDGAFEAWPRTKKFPSFRKTIFIKYGEPISTEQIKHMDDRQLAQFVTDRLRQMQNECRISAGKEPYEYDFA